MAVELEDMEQLERYYEDIEDLFNLHSDYSDMLNMFMADLEQAHADFFSGQSSPGGTKWTALRPSTIARKGHSTILVDTGRLKASLTGRSGDSIREVISEGTNHGISFGTSVPYSIYHQQEPGGGGSLPQREHVGINDPLLDGLTDRIADRTVVIVLGD